MALALILAAVALLTAHLVTVALYLRRLTRPAPAVGSVGEPHITLLRPVCGVDPFDAETLQSSFALDYPSYDIIFCAQTPDDPAVALVRRLIAENPGVPAQLLIGYDKISANPKLNNLFKGWNASPSDWLCMADSNLLLPPDYLRTLIACWGPETGLVSSPAIGTRPANWGGHLECAALNGNQARLQFAADSLGIGFAQGKTLLFNRALLEQAGGYVALGTHLAEDATATRLIRGIGRKVSLPPQPFAQPIGARSLRTVWKRQVRWSVIRRDAFPVLFTLEFLNGALVPFGLALTGAVLAGASPALALGYLAVWYLAEAFLMRRAGWPASWRDVAVLPLRDVMLPAVWAATFTQRGFVWRGTAMAPSAAAE